MHQSINTTLGTLHVEISGEGPAVILWHSLFLNNRQWDRVLPALAEQRRIIAIEDPGHGQSGLSLPSFTLEDYMMLNRPDLVTTYNDLSTPRLMLIGTEDEVWSPEAAHAIVKESSHSTIVTVAGASHVMPLERPDATIASIFEFWDRVHSPVLAGMA